MSGAIEHSARYVPKIARAEIEVAFELAGEVRLLAEPGFNGDFLDECATQQHRLELLRARQRHPGMRCTAKFALKVSPQLTIGHAAALCERRHVETHLFGPRPPIGDSVKPAHRRSSRGRN